MMGEALEVAGEGLHRAGALVGVGAEHLVVCHPAGAEVPQRGDHLAGRAGVAHRGDPRRPPGANAGAGLQEKFFLLPRGLDPDHVEDPLPEVVLLDHAGEAGQLEVGVAVDEAREEGSIGKRNRLGALGRRNGLVRTNGENPPIVSNEEGAIRDRGALHRKEPRRGETPHQCVPPPPGRNGECVGQKSFGS